MMEVTRVQTLTLSRAQAGQTAAEAAAPTGPVQMVPVVATAGEAHFAAAFCHMQVMHP